MNLTSNYIQSLCPLFFNRLDMGIILVNNDLRILFMNQWIEKHLSHHIKPIQSLKQLFQNHKTDYIESLIHKTIQKKVSNVLSQAFHQWIIPLIDSRFPDGLMRQGGLLTPFTLPINNTTYSLIQIRNESDAVLRIQALKTIKKTLQNSLKEKDILIREIHHRVKNNMQVISSLLNLQKMYINDDRFNSALQESQNRIHSMSLIHEKLYRSKKLSTIYAKDYIEDLVNYLKEFFNLQSHRIQIFLDIDNTEISIDQATPLGLILNELISNALKHAFPDGLSGDIHIQFHQINQKIELVVSDTGIGLPESILNQCNSTFGIELIRGLSEHQLQGTFKIESNSPSGVIFRIQINQSEHYETGVQKKD